MFLSTLLLITLSLPVFATTAIGGIAVQIQTQFSSIILLLSSGVYLLGIFLIIGGIMRLKTHRDNPVQNPIGVPLIMMSIGALLVYFFSFVPLLGGTFFSSATSLGTLGSSSLS